MQRAKNIQETHEEESGRTCSISRLHKTILINTIYYPYWDRCKDLWNRPLYLWILYARYSTVEN